jgi:hypothetical protein
MSKYWASAVPTHCETCGTFILNQFYDAKTQQGSWACMCPLCFKAGPGIGKLGTGLGQEYTRGSPDKFYLTAG